MRYLLYLFILLVSLYDGYWCYQIPVDYFVTQAEYNPIVVILVNSLGIIPFILLKITTTLLVISVCEILHKLRYRYIKYVIGGLCIFQLWLLLFLELGHLYDLISVRKSMIDNLLIIFKDIKRNYI